MTGQRAVADAEAGDLRKGGLESRKQLALELAVDLRAGIGALHIAADIGVEQDGVRYPIAVLAEAANGNIDIEADVVIHYAERNRTRRAVFVADKLLGVEEIDALILRGLAAEGKTLADILENRRDRAGQIAVKKAGLGGHVICIFSGLRADVNDLALVNDDHALTVGNGNDGAVRDHVIRGLVRSLSGAFLLPLDNDHVRRKRIAIEVFFPLIGKNAARRAESRFDKSHDSISFFQFRYNGFRRRGCIRAP